MFTNQLQLYYLVGREKSIRWVFVWALFNFGNLTLLGLDRYAAGRRKDWDLYKLHTTSSYYVDFLGMTQLQTCLIPPFLRPSVPQRQSRYPQWQRRASTILTNAQARLQGTDGCLQVSFVALPNLQYSACITRTVHPGPELKGFL